MALALPSLEARVAVQPASGLRLGPLELADAAELDRALEHGREPAPDGCGTEPAFDERYRGGGED